MFLNCQQDDLVYSSDANTNKTYSNYTIKTVSMDAINQNNAAKQALTTFKKKTLKSAQTTTANKIVVYENLNVLVDDSEAKYMEKIDGSYHSYTFKALDMSATDQKKNLVLSLKDDGSYRVVLLNYYLTPNDLATYKTTGALDLDTKANLTVVDSNTYTIDVYSKNVAPTTSGGGPDCLVPDITPGANCTAGGNHTYGQVGCTGGPGEVATPDVFNGFTLDWDCIDTHMGSGGGPNNPGPSGTPSGNPPNTNPNGGSDNDNNANPDDEFATASDLEEMNEETPIDGYFEMIDDQILQYLPPCKDSILNNIKTLENGKISDIIKKFTDRDTTAIGNYNWMVAQNNLSGIELGQTLPQFVNTASGNYIKTNLNENRLDQATDLLIAQVIMHEAIHAYILNYLSINGRPFPWQTTLPFNEMVKEYDSLSVIGSNGAFNIAQHNQFIRDNMVNAIKTALKEYGTAQGYNLRDVVYEDLAWAGLQTTSAYDSLPISIRNRIELRIEAERTSSINGSITPKGTKACD